MAVYPPKVVTTLPGRFLTWALPEGSVLVSEQTELVSRVGLLVRDVVQDGVSKPIGGIGGDMTHASKQGQGLAGLSTI